jgi:hypothetical protein
MSNQQAFPVPAAFISSQGDILESSEGMTLRDYFAAKAMQAILLDPRNESESYDVDARCSYIVADAMLKAREK